MAHEVRSDAPAAGSSASAGVSPQSARSRSSIDGSEARSQLPASASRMAHLDVAGGRMPGAGALGRNALDRLAYGNGHGRHLCESDESDESDNDAYGARARGRHALTSTWSHYAVAPSYSGAVHPSSAANVSVSIGKAGVLSRHLASASGAAGARCEAASHVARTAGSAAGYYSQAEEQAAGLMWNGPVRGGDRADPYHGPGALGAAAHSHANLRVQNWAAGAGSEGHRDGSAGTARVVGRLGRGGGAGGGGGGAGLVARKMRARAELLAGAAGLSDEDGGSDEGWGVAEHRHARAGGYAGSRGLFPPI